MTAALDPGWYVRRLRRMSPAEVAWRVADRGRMLRWARRQVRPGDPIPRRSSAPGTAFATPLPPASADRVPADVRAAVRAAADELLTGRWEVLGAVREDLAAPDWFRDPVTGVRSDPRTYAFRVRHRSLRDVGDVKQVWELSRHGHVTLLATAWACTHDPAYAERAAAHLRSWWSDNPFLSGVHWTSGIEVGLRLLAWTWTRRLLQDWDGAEALFERNDLAHAQLRWHQEYLAAFRSRGSSANNHVVAEAAGLLAASCAFPWFEPSARWRDRAAAVLERELLRNTFDSGMNRELASEYHGFVGLLGLLGAIEAEAAGHPVGDPVWHRLVAMADVSAALLDQSGRPPRQGDGDDARAVLLDPPAVDGWHALLSVVAELTGPQPWWPPVRPTAVGALVGALLPRPRPLREPGPRPAARPDHLADAGVTLLRTRRGDRGPELWCRCDGGPHGYLAIAGHAHADALAIEVRHGGVDVLADPGTFSYRSGDPWRDYSRATRAHTTIEVSGADQSVPGGPFLWTQHARTVVHDVVVDDDADVVHWSASHDGYLRLDPPVHHLRRVELDRPGRVLRVDDVLRTTGPHPVRVSVHLGPDVTVSLAASTARLSWPCGGATAEAVLALPAELAWSQRRGSTDPLAGWYAPSLGRRVPATTLLGEGLVSSTTTLRTVLRVVAEPASPAGITGRRGSLYCS